MTPSSAFRRMLLALAGLLLGAAVASACSSDEVISTATVLSIGAPEEVIAGTSISLTLESDGAGDVRLDVIDAFATTTLTVAVLDGNTPVFTSIEIPGAMTRSSGIVSFRAVGALGEQATTSTVVLPAAATDPLDVLVGPRTIVADGADETMAIGFVTDRFGNPILDGSPVELTIVEERGAVTVLDAVMDGGLAARLIGSGTVAQRVELFASIDDGALASRSVDFAEVPGPASIVDVGAPELADRTDPLVADGRSFVDVVTGEIDDRFGNQLPDGHLVRLQTRGPDGVGQLTARTIDGIARFSVVAPRLPGTVTITAQSDGTSSGAIELDFDPAISEIPVDWEWDDNVLAVSIGPVLDHVGSVVVDGTPASVVVSGLGIDPVDVELIDGRATVSVDSNERVGVGRVEVKVLGVDAEEELS